MTETSTQFSDWYWMSFTAYLIGVSGRAEIQAELALRGPACEFVSSRRRFNSIEWIPPRERVHHCLSPADWKRRKRMARRANKR